MAKTTFLQIRCSPEDRDRLAAIAAAEHLDLSTWARRILMQTLDRWENRNPALKRVAERESSSAYASKGRSTSRKG